jgi:hypothetical protein
MSGTLSRPKAAASPKAPTKSFYTLFPEHHPAHLFLISTAAVHLDGIPTLALGVCPRQVLGICLLVGCLLLAITTSTAKEVKGQCIVEACLFGSQHHSRLRRALCHCGVVTVGVDTKFVVGLARGRIKCLDIRSHCTACFKRG